MAVNSSKIALMSVWATKVLETARAPHLRQAQHRQRDLRQTQNRQRDLRQTQNRQRDLHHRPQCRRQRLVAAAASTTLLQALGLDRNAAVLNFQRFVHMGL
jgi:hypothetical protein